MKTVTVLSNAFGAVAKLSAVVLLMLGKHEMAVALYFIADVPHDIAYGHWLLTQEDWQ